MSATNRIEVGFTGNQVISLKLDDKRCPRLRKRLSSGGWQRSGRMRARSRSTSPRSRSSVAAGGHSVGFGSS